MGALAIAQHELKEASSIFNRSLTIARELEFPWGIAVALSGLGKVALIRGDYDAARRLLEESLVQRRECGHKSGIAEALLALGWLALIRADWGAARSNFAASLVIWRELAGSLSIISCLEGLACVAAARGLPERAAQLFGAMQALQEAQAAHLSADAKDRLGLPEEAFTPVERMVARQMAAAREVLGEDPFAAACATGRAMSMEEAVTLAVDGADDYAFPCDSGTSP